MIVRHLRRWYHLQAQSAPHETVKDNLALSHDMEDGSRSSEETTVLDTVLGIKLTLPKDEVRDEEPMLPRRSSRI